MIRRWCMMVFWTHALSLREARRSSYCLYPLPNATVANDNRIISIWTFCYLLWTTIQGKYKALKTIWGLFGWLAIFRLDGFKFIVGGWLSSKFEVKFSSTRGVWGISLNVAYLGFQSIHGKPQIIIQISRKEPHFVRVQKSSTQVHFGKATWFCSSSYSGLLEV